MSASLDEKLEPIDHDIVERNAGESEFHQAVREVLQSLDPCSRRIRNLSAAS
jgi:glutamate dehydrogenase (NADP+)